MRDTAFNTVTRTPATDLNDVAVPVPYDRLAAPSGEDLISAALTLWPQGAAWGSPDGEAVPLSSNLARFTRVLIEPFIWLYARAWGLAREATVQGALELLPEWNNDHGLPEKCFTSEQTSSQRLKALIRKVRAEPVNHPADFIRYALDYGFEIEIEEPAIFECGFSECGGRHTTGSYAEETYWIVRVRDAAVDYFEAGVSELGRDPLFSYGQAEQVLCLLRQMAPAWTLPVLHSWIDYAALGDGEGNAISNGYNEPLLLPLNS